MHQLGNLLNQSRLVHRIGNLGYYDSLTVFLPVFDFGLGPYPQLAPTSMIGRTNSADTHDLCTGGKVRSRNIFHQFVNGNLRVVNQGDDTVDNLPKVMGRNIGGHTYRNSVRAVYQKMGKP